MINGYGRTASGGKWHIVEDGVARCCKKPTTTIQDVPGNPDFLCQVCVEKGMQRKAGLKHYEYANNEKIMDRITFGSKMQKRVGWSKHDTLEGFPNDTTYSDE